jgi:exodeoxyribonuclease VII large subunit
VTEGRVWSVSEITGAVRSILEESLPPLWISGEVANWTRASSGHCYFTLKDARSQLRCVLWRAQAQRLPMDPENGMRVRILGGLTVYEARGDLQCTVRSLEGEGEDGLWKRAFERLKAQLEGEGLLDPSRRRPLPRYPSTIGIVTSPTGAALQDLLTVLGRRAPWARVLLRGSRVQGEGAAHEIAEAIGVLSGSGLVDVLIVGRGGGSIEDLWAFNEEPVVRAIVSSPVPVISAVGHETDVTLSDLVADLRAPTPSAAAEAVVPDAETLLALLETRFRPRLGRGLLAQVERRRMRVERLKGRLEREGRRTVTAGRGALAPKAARLETLIRRAIERRRKQLGVSAAQLDALSPLSILGRGYSVARSDDGSVLRTRTEVVRARSFRLLVSDGEVRCDVAESIVDPSLTGAQSNV